MRPTNLSPEETYSDKTKMKMEEEEGSSCSSGLENREVLRIYYHYIHKLFSRG
jgi:hypothetical protein